MLCSSVWPKLHLRNSGSRKLLIWIFLQKLIAFQSYEILQITLEVEKKGAS